MKNFIHRNTAGSCGIEMKFAHKKALKLFQELVDITQVISHVQIFL